MTLLNNIVRILGGSSAIHYLSFNINNMRVTNISAFMCLGTVVSYKYENSLDEKIDDRRLK